MKTAEAATVRRDYVPARRLLKRRGAMEVESGAEAERREAHEALPKRPQRRYVGPPRRHYDSEPR